MQSKNSLKVMLKNIESQAFKWLELTGYICVHTLSCSTFVASPFSVQGQRIFPVSLSWKTHMGKRHLCEGKLVLFGKADYDFQQHRGKNPLQRTYFYLAFF